MALQASGSITLGQIQTGFGGINPIGMNEYYRGGVNVPNAGTLNSAIPTSGAIAMSNFYGAKILNTGSYQMSGNTGSTGTFSVYKGPTSSIYYTGWHSTLNSLYRPLGGSSPSENAFGSVTGSSYPAHNGTFSVRSLYSVYEERSDGYRSLWHVMAAYSSTIYLPNNDASFKQASFPIIGNVGAGISSPRVNLRSNANYDTYATGGGYYSRWIWLVSTASGSSSIPGSYTLSTGALQPWSLTIYA
jgi:hypothetical protein